MLAKLRLLLWEFLNTFQKFEQLPKKPYIAAPAYAAETLSDLGILTFLL